VDNFEGDEPIDDFMPPKSIPTPYVLLHRLLRFLID